MPAKTLKLLLSDLATTVPLNITLPSLQRLLNRSTSELMLNPEGLICQWAGIHDLEPPIAAITGLGDNLSIQSDYWLRADPVQLQADLSTAYLLGNQHLNLQENEIKDLVTEINKLIAADNLQLIAPHPTRWYLHSTKPPKIITHSLQQAIDKDIASHLPMGENQAYWRRLFTEIQMLLHASSINQKRQAHGLPAVNALWFWGVGQLPTIKAGAWQSIWCYDDPLLKGLGRLMDCPTQAVQENFLQILPQMKSAGDYILQLSAKAFENNWELLEKNWLQPIWQALRNKELSQINFYIGTDEIFNITAKRSYFFWKKRYPLTYYLDYEKKNNPSPVR